MRKENSGIDGSVPEEEQGKGFAVGGTAVQKRGD